MRFLRRKSDLGAEEIKRLRKEIWQEHAERQVEMLRSLREDLSSRRWKIMLDIDAIRSMLHTARTKESDPELRELIEQIEAMLDQVHRDLSRIPEDVIPAF